MRYTFMRFPGFKDKAVTLSYDDGVVYDKRLIEIMDKNGLKGTFNINSGLFSEDGERRLTMQQAKELYTDSGHEVAIHGKRHLHLTDVPTALAVDDVLNDRIALEELFGTVITGMAYPYGLYDDNVVEILQKCGIEYARTTVSTGKFDVPTDWLRLPATCHHSNSNLMKFAADFLTDEPHVYYRSYPPKLFYLWGHSYEFNDADNWHIIEEFAEFIGNRSDVWYATNIEIYKYVKAYEALQFSANGELVYNPSLMDIYINYFDKEFVIPSGKTVKLT